MTCTSLGHIAQGSQGRIIKPIPVGSEVPTQTSGNLGLVWLSQTCGVPTTPSPGTFIAISGSWRIGSAKSCSRCR